MINLQRADQPARVVRMQPRGGRRIDRRQSGVQRSRSLQPGNLFQFTAKYPIRRRTVE